METAKKKKSLDEIFESVRDMDEYDLTMFFNGIVLMGKDESKRKEFLEVCLDYANDKFYCERLGVNYANPSSEDLNRIKVFVYLAEFVD